MSIRNPEKYIQSIDEIIEKKLSENSFSVQKLAETAGCSRMSLYRNVKRFTGNSPSKYILKKRLHRSTEMLQQTNKTIQDIANEIGFNHPGYFSKKFKEEYGCTPTNYGKSNLK